MSAMQSSSIMGNTSIGPRVPVPQDVRTFQFDQRRAGQAPRDYQTELVQSAWVATLNAAPGDRNLVFLATGGGKTRVLNDVLFTYALPLGARVLWLAPGWELLAQAADDACARYAEARSLVTYIGGDGTEITMFGAPRSPNPMLTFVTLQTFSARRNSDFVDRQFDLIVLDEVHYGEHGKLQKQVYEKYKDMAIFLGATATKRVDSGYNVIGHQYDLAALVERGILARPELVSVETNIDWSPGVDTVNGDITARSLDELARSEVRNATIVTAYQENAALLGPTMVFACNVAHADLLTTMLRSNGIRAAATHYRMPEEAAKDAVSRFRTGELDVIVNVRSLTMGVDIPHTQGIFLTRPTTSDILLTQMIGRGSRKTATKNDFVVVDFVDNITGPNGVYVKRPDGFLGSPPRDSHRRPLHEYVPAKLEVIRSADSAVDGLEVQPTQTFSVEFLIQRAAHSTSLAPAVVDELEAAFPMSTPVPSTSWTACVEGELVRVTSPVYQGVAGLSELTRTVDSITTILAAHHYTIATGDPIHVLLGWCPDLTWLKDVVRYVGFFEPALASLAAPPLAVRPIRRPARRAVGDVLLLDDADSWFDYVNRTGGSYHSFDMRPLFEKGYAVDVPLHAETLDGRWLATWVSLAMHILRAAEEGRPLNGDPCRRVQSAPICRGPRGNVDELCAFIGGSLKLASLLRARREDILSLRWLPDPRYGGLARRVEESWRLAG
ncbi:hypothetical protein BH11MYX4_BH11MYX4_02850 [soil metagenome]